jgi:uncharacterized phage protein (TIGR01671 family)
MSGRELKFRVWNLKRKEMFNLYGISKDYIWKDTLDGVGCHGSPDYRGDVEVMQYTGLKDKNGKEIYEGDILGDRSDEDSDKIIVKYEEMENCGCCSNHSGIGFNFNRNPYTVKEDYEVIGNIYENPELL